VENELVFDGLFTDLRTSAANILERQLTNVCRQLTLTVGDGSKRKNNYFYFDTIKKLKNTKNC
jgi:hypothetical protein